MAETLGSLCDKLTVVKLKQWHSVESERLASLGDQEIQLRREIDDFVFAAVHGVIAPAKLTFAANKVYRTAENITRKIEGSIGEVFSQLAEVNCTLWHEQEKVYEFDRVPSEEKDRVVKSLAVLNLERNQCIDKIDNNLRILVTSYHENT